MTWLLRLLGNGFGWMMAGPVWAMLGVMLGRQMMRNWQAWQSPAPGDDPTAAQPVFLVVAFQVMGHLARADGPVSRQEIDTAQAVMQHLRLTDSQRQRAVQWFNEGKQAGFALEAALRRFRKACGGDPVMLRRFVEIQFCMAYADGLPQPRERALLLFIANRLGVSRWLFESLEAFVRQQAGADQPQRAGARAAPPAGVAPVQAAYEALGLKPTASDDEVKLAYRRLLNRHHPDKLAGQNPSPEMLARATAQTRQIKAAYEQIRAARGL
jgi:DnaJ like chaperone protein